jgi:hypothetical protein
MKKKTRRKKRGEEMQRREKTQIEENSTEDKGEKYKLKKEQEL